MLKRGKYIHIHRFVIIPSEKENKQLGGDNKFQRQKDLV